MTEQKFELEALARQAGVFTPESDVLMGRRAGEAVKAIAGLNSISKKDDIIIVTPAGKTVTPSFFIGMLQGSVDEFKNAEEVMDKVRLENASNTNHTNFITAVRTVKGSIPVRPRNWLEKFGIVKS